MPKAPAVHIQDDRFPSRVLCGTPLEKVAKGGRVCSDTTPPAVVDDRGSCNAATCVTCLMVWRRRSTSSPVA